MLAEALGKTLEELHTGQAAPISNQEVVMWQAFFAYREHLREQEMDRANRDR